MEVSWRDPPDDAAPYGEGTTMDVRDGRVALLREIAKEPGRWALFATMGTPASANNVASRVRAGVYLPGFAARIHHNEVYVRFTEESDEPISSGESPAHEPVVGPDQNSDAPQGIVDEQMLEFFDEEWPPDPPQLEVASNPGEQDTETDATPGSDASEPSALLQAVHYTAASRLIADQAFQAALLAASAQHSLTEIGRASGLTEGNVSDLLQKLKTK